MEKSFIVQKSMKASLSQAETSLLREEPLSSLCKFLRDSTKGDAWGDFEFNQLSNHLEAVNQFFASGIQSSAIPESYLEVFQILCASFALYSAEAKKRLENLKAGNVKLKEELESVKSENGKLSIQQNDISSLNIELGLANERNALLQSQLQAQGPEVRKRLLRELGQKLRLTVDIPDQDTLLKCIEQQNKDIELKTCESIAHALSIPEEPSVDAIVATVSSRLESSKKTNKKLKSELALAEEAISEARTRIKSYKSKLSRIPELEEQNSQLQLRLKNQKQELKQLQRDQKNTVPSPEPQQELEKLKQTIEDMSRLYEKQADELREAVESRTALAETVKKLLAVNQELERARDSPRKADAPAVNLDWITEVLSGINHSDIANLCQEGNDPEFVLRKVVNFVNRELGNLDYFNERVNKLKSVVYGQIKFLNMLTSSRDLVTTVVLDQNLVDDAIACIKSQIARTQDFLHEHAIGYLDEPSIFEGLLKKGSSADLMELLEVYLSKHGEPCTDEGEELFAMFCQAVSANDILRKFAESAQNCCARQTDEIKRMREYMSQLQKSCEAQCQAARNETEEKVEGVVNAVRSILRESVLDGNLTQPILESLEALNDVVEIDDREYVDSLQKQNAKMQSELAEISDQKEILLQRAKSDLQQVQRRLDQLKSESDFKLNEQKEAYARLEAQLETKNALIDDMKESGQRLQEQNEQLSRQLVESNEKCAKLETEVKSLISELQAQVAMTKVEYEKLLESTKASEMRVSTAEVSQLQDSCHKLRAEKREMKAILKEQVAEKEGLQAQLEKSQLELDRLWQGQEKTAQQAQELSRKFKEVYAQSRKLLGERKTLERKVKESEEKEQRTLTLMESKMKMKLLEKDGETQTKIQEAKNEFNSTMQKLLVGICKMFSAYVNVEQPITIENVELILKQVKCDVESVPSLRELERVVCEIQRILRVESGGQIEDELRAILSERDQMLNQIHRLEADRVYLGDLEFWVERMFNICSGGIDVSSDLSIMQKRIEEVIYRAVGEPNGNEVQLLRTQKKILTSPSYNSARMPRQRPSLRHAIVAVSFALRVQKASGHQESVLGLPSRSIPQVMEPEVSQVPVFSQFIFNE